MRCFGKKTFHPLFSCFIYSDEQWGEKCNENDSNSWLFLFSHFIAFFFRSIYLFYACSMGVCLPLPLRLACNSSPLAKQNRHLEKHLWNVFSCRVAYGMNDFGAQRTGTNKGDEMICIRMKLRKLREYSVKKTAEHLDTFSIPWLRRAASMSFHQFGSLNVE